MVSRVLVLAAAAAAPAWGFRVPARTMRMSADVPATIVGLGRIGGLIASVGDGKDTIVGRQDKIAADGSGPIYVCTRNDVLDGIVADCPEGRREDLVFMQNGFIESWMKGKGLEDNTQALLYFAVTKAGADPIDGVTPLNPEGLTAATGKWGAALTARLAKAGLKCNDVDAVAYRAKMFEKLFWISCLMLVGAAHDCASVGDAQKEHGEELAALIAELAAAVTARYGIEFEAGVVERLFAYTDVVANFPCGVKEFEWRNGFFWALSREAVKAAGGDEAADVCPIHTKLLRGLEAEGKIGFDLPGEPDMQLLMGTTA
uniref:Uncharacterized protein n=1 Tax=Phaeomonas parva TaxID=124430 RepID=A0A7S1TQA1_9STRA|mmetsp:Transcript_10947/g.33320  ORF Transcript_10947/g.33320 Transcript_10947/m.33320 type:complete len:316 (-) Transcript_10947:56-1003(-)